VKWLGASGGHCGCRCRLAFSKAERSLLQTSAERPGPAIRLLLGGGAREFHPNRCKRSNQPPGVSAAVDAIEGWVEVVQGRSIPTASPMRRGRAFELRGKSASACSRVKRLDIYPHRRGSLEQRLPPQRKPAVGRRACGEPTESAQGVTFPADAAGFGASPAAGRRRRG